ncbi:unnamed protein product [Peniophora sp. CBMAI 1063]|nr:unnamed protein product [Peniophora sp. CBMAI 1063]
MKNALDTCTNCGNLCEKRLCKRCHMATYCNAECQKAHWPSHKKICAVLKIAKHLTPTQSETFAASQRLMQLVALAFYDGRRKDPHVYRVWIERMISTLLKLDDLDDGKATVTPEIELDWRLLPKGESFVLQLEYCLLHGRGHPVVRANASARKIMSDEIATLREDIAKIERVDRRGKGETGCVIPVISVGMDYANSLSEINFLPMTILASDAKRHMEVVESILAVPEKPTPGWRLRGLAQSLNEALASDPQFCFSACCYLSPLSFIIQFCPLP